MEANLTPSDGTSGVGPAQVQILSFGKEVWSVNGVCPGSTPGQNSVPLVGAYTGMPNSLLVLNQGSASGAGLR